MPIRLNVELYFEINIMQFFCSLYTSFGAKLTARHKSVRFTTTLLLVEAAKTRVKPEDSCAKTEHAEM